MSAHDANTLELLPLLPFKIISYLIENNEMIWKLLKHDEPDAWQKSNLTRDEKRALVYDGISEMVNYRVFMDSGQDASWTKTATILRVPILEVIPSNQVVARVVVGFEVYTHYQISTLSNYQVRADRIAQEIITTLNEKDVGGIGKLFWNARANPRCRITTIGNIPYRGKGIVMCNWVA